MEIEIDGWYYYAQQLPFGLTRFMDFRSINGLSDFSILPYDKAMFDIFVYNHVLSSGEWKVVARKMPIPSNIPRFQYIHFDDLNPNKWELYNIETGKISLSTKESCESLEKCAVWPQWKVEERIKLFFKK